MEKTGGDIIKNRRIKMGYSLQELAEKINIDYVDQDYLSKLEDNEIIPYSFNLISKIEDTLNLKGLKLTPKDFKAKIRILN